MRFPTRKLRAGVVNITSGTGTTYAWQRAKLWQDANARAAIFSQFWRYVQRADAKACWLWQGEITPYGYGHFYFRLSTPWARRIRLRAHRFAWLASRGDIPAGQEVCHRCDVPHCVNPGHLFLGSRRDNHLDSVCKGRKRAWGVQKLNAAQVREIRRRAASGELQYRLAQEFGIAKNTVSGIVHRRSWAHLAETDVSAGRRQAS